MRNIREYTLLDGVTETGAANAVNGLQYTIYTFQIASSAVTDGATITIEASLDNVSWVVYETFVITENGNQMYTIAGAHLKYIRANVIAYTDGAYTVKAVIG